MSEIVETFIDIGKIQEDHPGWIICSVEKYCSDYPSFKINWDYICEHFGVKPQEIFIVSSLPDNEDDPLFHVASKLTMSGFQIRKVGDFIKCTVCDSIIPSKVMFKQMRTKPDITWSDKCSGC
jgi:hypothetical protein